MPAFKVALLGAPVNSQAQLCQALTDAVRLVAWPVSVVSVVLADPASCTHDELIVLMGLPYPESPAMAASDQQIRLELARAGMAYDVLYGTLQEQLAQAIGLLERKLGLPLTTAPPPPLQTKPKQKPWVWLCDNCSDPQCEHQLLTQLLAQRATAP